MILSMIWPKASLQFNKWGIMVTITIEEHLKQLINKKEEWQTYEPINTAAEMMKDQKLREYERAIQRLQTQ